MILTGMPQRADGCVANQVNRAGDIQNSHPFELHVLFLETALESWRPYLLHLSVQVTSIVSITNSFSVLINIYFSQSGRAQVTVVGEGENHPSNFISVDLKDYQQLKAVEDQAADILLCLDSTMDTVRTFIAWSEKMKEIHDAFTKNGTEDAIMNALEEVKRGCEYTRKQADICYQKCRTHVL